ncbi:MAG: CreA family protein [Rhodospirillaceae bacterium]
MFLRPLALLMTLALFAAPAAAEEIGSVDTVFKFLGPNHKIVIEAFDDPKVPGVTCHVSRARTGGVSGAFGLAEDTSDASIACRQVGPITLPEGLKKNDGEQVFSERRSLLFKRLQVVRFFDEKRRVLIYLVYSDKIIEGSPKNAISSVPVMPWRE